MDIRGTHGFTRYPTFEWAQRVASADRPEDDWLYKVMPSGKGFIVVIFDQDGNELGPLP